MSGIGLMALFQQQREQGGQAGLEIARALSIAVDAELRRSISALDVLATSLHLDDDHIELFAEHANRAITSQHQWRAVILADTTGRTLMRTGGRIADASAGLVEPESFRDAVRTRKPVIGYLAQEPRTGEWGVPIRVPIVQEGQVKYVLTAVLRPESILDVVRRQRVPDDWVVAVADAHGLRLARTRNNAASVGTRASAELDEMIRSGIHEWRGMSHTSEGEAVYTALARLRESNWTIGVGIPPTAVEAGANRSLAAFGGGILLSLILGGLAAFAAARSINEPMAALRRAARDMGEGAAIAPPRTDIREIHEVGEALAASAEQRAASEVEREKLLRGEQEARAAAESANRAKDEFLAMLGHELRNPLGAIANSTRLLEDARIDAAGAARARAVIARQVEHLTRLTDDLLDAGRAIMGKIVLRMHPVDLAALAAQALATLDSSGRTRAHRVVAELESAWVEADAIRLDQIISNLVVNAVKYTPEGGTIRVAVKREGGETVLRVADDGIGLAPDLAARVFDLFVQGERDLDRAQGGLGIGLTLVRRLAELHGGSAAVASEGVGRGSEFTVRLPAIDPPAQRAPAPIDQAASGTRRVLVIEDNDDARETLAMLLQMMGHSVETAPDGVAGVANALASPPDVALVDVGLPGIDGYEVARLLRAELGSRPLLVAVTGYGLPEDRARAMQSGFDAHIVKPVDHHVLVDVLSISRPGLSEGAPT